ncbi:MAG: hypothetical protein KH452_11865 [Clostridiales bacterium]|nr:hypothetical protein [Clostridiales bacterium]
MLKVPQLDDLTYEQMMQRAVSRIPSMTDQWTDYNSHDPGITVLQTYAWLTDMLNYYMNATGDVHVEKYLKLLGIMPLPARASEGYVVLTRADGKAKIPKGTELLAGEIPFETAEDYDGEYNPFCSFINEVDGQGIDMTAFAGADGEYAEGFAQGFRERAVMYFGFEKPLKDRDRIYICVEQDERRNPFGEDFRLADVSFEIYTGQGWLLAEVEDGTCGFLKSGFLSVRITEDMQSFRHPDGLKKAYYIRGILREDTCDRLPRIGMVYVNPIKVVQQKKICEAGELRDEFRIGGTDGCAGQELLFDYPDVYSFALLLVSENGEREIWSCTEDLEQADYKDRVFTYEEDRQMIRFGDGIHGAVPEQKKSVYVTGLVSSLLSEGNVQAGEVKCPASADYQVSNPEATQGGRRRERVGDMIVRMEQELFVQNRMASAEDYETIIRRTPGLMLELVHVIPGMVYGELHGQKRSASEVVAVVKPYSTRSCPELSDMYQKVIRRHVEPMRLLNTKLDIVSPSYVGIEVHGRIVLEPAVPGGREAVLECLHNAIDYNRKKHPFGAVISYGKIFTSLEALEGVAKVQEFALERTGRAADKNERGDILLHEDALGFIRNVDLEFG